MSAPRSSHTGRGALRIRMTEWFPVALVATVIAANLTSLREPGFASNDGAQYMDVARHLLDGEGVSTRIAFYEKQHAQGSFPIPQTVFPPGYPIGIAAVMAVGVSAFDAAFFIGLASHIAVGLLLVLAMRICSPSRFLAAAVPVVWLTLATAQQNVLVLLSDVAYTLATVASVLAAGLWMKNERDERSALIWCGLFAGFAFALRYAGMFFGATIGLYFGFRALLARRRKEVVDAVWVLVPAGAVAVLVLLRNLAAAGEFMGNPGVARDPVVGDVVRSGYRAIGQLLGVSWSDVFAGELPDVLVPLGLGLGALFLLPLGKRPAAQRPPEALVARRTMLGLSALYVAISAVALTYLALARSSDLITSRYLLPLVPFALIILASVADAHSRRWGLPPRRRAVSAILVASGLFVGQWHMWTQHLTDLRTDPTYAILERALVTEAGSREALTRVQVGSDAEAPKVMSESQLGSLFLDSPLIELTEERYTTEPWTISRVRSLFETFGVTHLLVVPGLADDPETNSRRLEDFLADLSGGVLPAWLELEYSNPALRIYRVELGRAGPG